QANITADVHVHLVVGVDSQGFFLDATGNPDPEITIDHITAEVQGEARLGFIDTNLDEGILTLDPDVKLLINLHDPGTGAAADRFVREAELADVMPDAFATVALVAEGDPSDNTPDMKLTAKFFAAAFDFPILQDVGLTISWPDLGDPGTATITPTID